MHSTRRFVLLLLGCAALLPRPGAACDAPGVEPRFDALECVELLAGPRPQRNGYLFRNRCPEPIAMLVVLCDLTAQPACRTDPLHSRGWSTRRGIDYLSAAHTGATLLDVSWNAPSPPSGVVHPLAPGVQRGWRAQIAACRLNPDASALEADPCASRLAALKRALDATRGESMHAVLRKAHGVCPG
jgi:hypothetical protein